MSVHLVIQHALRRFIYHCLLKFGRHLLWRVKLFVRHARLYVVLTFVQDALCDILHVLLLRNGLLNVAVLGDRIDNLRQFIILIQDHMLITSIRNVRLMMLLGR